MAPEPARPRDAQRVACPCRHGDVPAEMAGQRPLLERAAAGDREAFVRLYQVQVEGVYRYLLAWTGDRAEAAELTGQVFRDALHWLPATVGGEVEAGAWLIAMARDAVAQRRGSGWIAGPGGADGPRAPVTDAVAAVARLGDPEREVVVLRLLLGHSLAHTSHLSGYSRRAVLELQLAACLAVWELTGGARAGPTQTTRAAPSPEEFERRLGRWEIDLAGSDPALADALAAAGSLRRAIPGYVVAPDDDLVHRLGRELQGEGAVDNYEHPLPPSPTLPGRGPRHPAVADSAARPRSAQPPGAAETGGAEAGGAEARAARRHWVATAVAAVGIVVVLALQVLDRPAPAACGDRPCPVPTTATAAAAGGDSLAPPSTTVVRSSTTGSTLPGLAPATTAPPSSAATAPPTTRPPTTAAPTTSAPRPPTTTRAPTTTAAPPTTLSATTTTAAPAPT